MLSEGSWSSGFRSNRLIKPVVWSLSLDFQRSLQKVERRRRILHLLLSWVLSLLFLSHHLKTWLLDGQQSVLTWSRITFQWSWPGIHSFKIFQHTSQNVRIAIVTVFPSFCNWWSRREEYPRETFCKNTNNVTGVLEYFERMVKDVLRHLGMNLVSKEWIHFTIEMICKYSETRLLRTLKGNEKRYVVTKVRSMQNAIFLTGRTGFTCSRERSATEDAYPSWMSFIVRCSYGEIAFQGIVNLKTCREIEIETEKLDDMLVIRKKRTKERAKKCSWRENWYVISNFVPRSVRLIRKNWQCPWSTERTLQPSVRTKPCT